MADIDYYRILRTHRNAITGEMTVADKRPEHGGESETFFAMENQTGSYDSIPQGIYTLKMVRLGNLGTCLRFIEIPGRDGTGRPFLIHATRRWQNLAGCIAPGMSAQQAGRRAGVNTQLRDSRAALDRIFELLGGFEAGDFVQIQIRNNAPGGDTWTKQQFISRRTRGRRT